MTLSLSSFTENLPEVVSRYPKTVTAVPSGADADEWLGRIKHGLMQRTGKIEVKEVSSMGRGVIRIVQRGQRRVVQECPLAREWERGIVSDGV